MWRMTAVVRRVSSRWPFQHLELASGDPTPATAAPEPRSPITARAVMVSLRWITAGTWSALTGLWLLYVAQQPAPAAFSRGIALLTLASTLLLLASQVALMWRSGDRNRLVAIVFLIVLALALYLPGIDHEVGDNYYADEGIYRSNANEINQGHFLRQAFNYPHLLYYLDAFAIWIGSLFHPAILSWADALYGVSDWHVVCRLLARGLTALAGALTVVPVFLFAERLAGLGAGVVAGVLIAAASEYHAGSQLHTCDILSAFFAMGCFAYVGRLLRRECLRDYLLAGVWAGLAAGSKYPAGLVALAIATVWLRGRIREREAARSDDVDSAARGLRGLLVAGVSALATFLLTTPSLVVYYQVSILGDKGALFGWRQYTRGRWIGVVEDSNLAYYLDLVIVSLGWPAIAAGLLGLIWLRRELRIDVAWLLPFPFAYLWLMTAMSIVVERNLYPALPPLATLLGVGIWTVCRRLAKLFSGSPRAAPWLIGVFAFITLALPLWRVTHQEIAFCRPSTRQLASEWIYQNLPHGSRVFKERYTPNIHRKSFIVGKTRWVGSYSVDELRGYGLDYVVLSHAAYQRFLDPSRHFESYQAVVERNYREIFERLELVRSFEPGLTRRGPMISIYRVQAAEDSDAAF